MKNLCVSRDLPFDVAVVLGAAVRKGGKPGRAMLRRTTYAIELVKKGIVLKLMVTGGPKAHRPSEAKVMKNIATSQGLSDNLVVMEDHASSTFESAHYCSKIIQKKGWKNILLITDRFHLPRAKLAFWLFGVSVSGSTPQTKGWKSEFGKNSYYVFREIFAIIWYLLKFAGLKLPGKWLV